MTTSGVLIMSWAKRKLDQRLEPKEPITVPSRKRSDVKRCDCCGYYRPIINGKLCAGCLKENPIEELKVELPKPREIIIQEDLAQVDSNSDDIISFIAFLLFLWWALSIYAAIGWICLTLIVMGVMWLKELISKKSSIN